MHRFVHHKKLLFHFGYKNKKEGKRPWNPK
jgi:hypothetical protein